MSDGCFGSIQLPDGRDVFVADQRRGLLGFSGGGRDPGESALEAAVRELSEELGVETVATSAQHVAYRDAAGTEFDSTYLFSFGNEWKIYGDKPKKIDNFDTQLAEVSKVIGIHLEDIVARREFWRPKFHTGHWKMVGWLARYRQCNLAEPIRTIIRENPWDLGLI